MIVDPATKCLWDKPNRNEPAIITCIESGVEELEYPFHDKDALITACGRICMYRKKINISTVLAGQRVGIKEIDDGIWLISFMSYDLGYIDLEQKT